MKRLILSILLLFPAAQAHAIDLTRAPTPQEISKMGAVELCYHVEVRDTAPLAAKVKAEGLQCAAILEVAKRMAAEREVLGNKKKEEQARRSKAARAREVAQTVEREKQAARVQREGRRLAAERATRERQRQAQQAAAIERQRQAQQAAAIERQRQAQQAAAIERQRQAEQAAALAQQRRLAAAIAEQQRAFAAEREREQGWAIMRQGLGMMNQPKTTTCQFNSIMNNMVCR